MTAWSSNRLDLFVIGTDSAIYHKAWDGQWRPSQTDWQRLGGTFLYDPVCVSWGPNRLDIFAIGTNHHLLHKWWDGSRWGPGTLTWEDFGGEWMDKPAVVSWGPSRLDVFLVGKDRGIYQKFWDGSHWNDGFVNMGGKVLHAPSVVSWAANRIDIFCTGTNSGVFHKWWDGSRWGPNGIAGEYEDMGGQIIGAPEAVCWGPNRIDVFGVGLDSALYHKWWDGSAWGPAGPAGAWENMGGACTTVPKVVSWAKERLDIFVVGTDNAIYHKWWTPTGGWGPSGASGAYEAMGGTVIKDISAVCWSADRIDMFVIGTGGAVHHKAYSPATGWTPSLTGWDGLGGVSFSAVNN